MPESKQHTIADKAPAKGFTLPEVTKDGSRFFRATSFELFAVSLDSTSIFIYFCDCHCYLPIVTN